jgi:type II secretion system protein G
MEAHMKARGEEGFTLVEMMIVVAIIAILVAILMPNFMRARAQAQTASCMMNLKEIATAMELYQSDNNRYPGASKAPLNASDTNLLPYIKQPPLDPAAPSTSSYVYSTTNPNAGNASYTIICPGLHDPATLAKISPGTTAQHIQYDSASGYSAVTSQ